MLDRVTLEIPLELDERTYGTAQTLQEQYVQPPASLFHSVGDEFRQRSRLLALKDGASRDGIFEAYGADLTLLCRYRDEFELFVGSAVRCSIKTGGSQEQDESKPEKLWRQIKEKMSPIGRAPLLELSHIRAALPAEQLLAELKEEFELGVERLLRTLSWWLQQLVEHDLVGLVEWTAPDVCRYHYFRHELKEEVLSSLVTMHCTFDETKKYGERHADMTVREIRSRITRFQERHVHSIVQVKSHGLTQYQKKMPKRIAQFLAITPQWLRPHLAIIEGQITMEEVIRLKVEEHEVVREEVLGVFKYSPGVALGGFNLVGWSGDDLRSEPTRVYRPASRWRSWTKTMLGWTVGLVSLAALCWAVVAFVAGVVESDRKQKISGQARYAGYLQQHQTSSILVALRGSPLELGKSSAAESVTLKYGGCENGFAVDDNQCGSIRLFAFGGGNMLPNGIQTLNPPTEVVGQTGAKIRYGDIDLFDAYGLTATLHVTSAKMSRMSYAVTWYNPATGRPQ